MDSYVVRAHNTATTSANKIHDDEVARRFGFRGGLVPGVDVYAYLTHVPAARWGLDWVRHGSIRARFVSPVYDGRRVEVTALGEDGLELHDDDGTLCATATIDLSPPSEPPDPSRWPDLGQRTDVPEASPETLTPGTCFGLEPHGFHAERAEEYLDDVRETLPLYAREAVAHPGWLLRDANYVLSRNVRLGPWIHVESAVQHFDVVHDGAEVSARAVVTGEWERKGHRFVELDVAHLADGRVVARTTHTAIYRPRS